MKIYVDGVAEKDFAPDQIVAGATFEFHAESYDEALKEGVKKVKNYIESVSETIDFPDSVFKTRAYSVQERFITNKITPTTMSDLNKQLEKRVSTGFYFRQFITLTFDYNKEQLSKLLVFSSKSENAPLLHIDFRLKNQREKMQTIIAKAYDNAKAKAEALAIAAGKTLGDCSVVEIDPKPSKYGLEIAEEAFSVHKNRFNNDIKEELKNIEDTFKPDDITVTKKISCIWETL